MWVPPGDYHLSQGDGQQRPLVAAGSHGAGTGAQRRARPYHVIEEDNYGAW